MLESNFGFDIGVGRGSADPFLLYLYCIYKVDFPSAEASLITLTPAQLSTIYCLNPHCYIATINYYKELILSGGIVMPVKVFPFYHIDWRCKIQIIFDGTHRSRASLELRTPIVAQVIPQPQIVNGIYMLSKIPAINGDEPWAVFSRSSSRF